MTEEKTKKTPRWVRVYPFVLIVGGALGLFASFMLSMDKIKLLENPSYSPPCNVNPIMSCTSVTSSPYGETLGMPNPFFGIAAFAVLVTIGMALLAGASFKNWFWKGLMVGSTLGLGFVHYLYSQSVYNIGKLCLYCMLVWSITIPIFWYTLLMNFRLGNLPVHRRMGKVVTFMRHHHFDILVSWYLILVTLILVRFWWYISG